MYSKKKMKKKYVYMLIVIAMLTFCCTALTFSKYVLEESSSIKVSAADFYFESSELDIYPYPDYYVTLDEKIITVTVKNYTGEFLTTNNEIIYKVVATLNGNEITSSAILISDWENGESDIKIDLSDYDLENNDELFILVTSSSPFVKTIGATYILNNVSENITYEVSDQTNSNFLVLTLNSNEYEGSVEVTIDDDLIINYSDSRLNILSDSTFSLQVSKNSTYEIILFKEVTENIYSANDVSVKKDGE